MTGLVVLHSIGRLVTEGSVGTVEGGVLAISEGRIVYAGHPDGLGAAISAGGFDVAETVDLEGALVTPGLIDAHSHPVYGGNRFAEIAMRSAGASYLEVAAAGGGISSTVAATRATAPAELEAATKARLESWLANGTTTLEAKTGYHLEREGELAAAGILHRLSGGHLAGGHPAGGEKTPEVEVTWLAGHAVAPEFAGDPEGYVAEACEWSPAARTAGARHADVFCDEGYFTPDQSRRLLESAKAAGVIPRIHADELARTGGARLAAELGCASADHLLRIDESDARALAGSGVVATLAPVTALAMGRTPPVKALVEAGVTIALGSDHNPGTCGTTSMSLVVALAVAELGMSVTAAIEAATAGGAASLRLTDRGCLIAGLRADVVAWDADHEGAFAWRYGLEPLEVWRGGDRFRRLAGSLQPVPGPGGKSSATT